jgi:hypothetical protein
MPHTGGPRQTTQTCRSQRGTGGRRLHRREVPRSSSGNGIRHRVDWVRHILRAARGFDRLLQSAILEADSRETFSSAVGSPSTGGGNRMERFRWIAFSPSTCCLAIHVVTPAPQSPPCATRPIDSLARPKLSQYEASPTRARSACQKIHILAATVRRHGKRHRVCRHVLWDLGR